MNSSDHRPTDSELLDRVKSLKPLIRNQQDEAERQGHYSAEVHERMLELGLYHLLTPRRYGGMEISIPSWLDIIVEVATADPGTAWCYALGHSHNIQAAALWPEQIQDEVFQNDRGYFRASHSLFPSGTATPVEGGYLLTGTSRYQSGSPYSSHAIVLTTVPDDNTGEPVPMQAILSADDFELLDDWGPDHVLGMRSSGSNSITFSDVFITEDHLVPPTWAGEIPSKHTGAALHDNSLYIGSVQSFLGAELAAVAVGTARAALEEWETLSRTRKATIPPFVTRDQDPISQKIFGEATIKTDAATAILTQIGQTVTRWAEAFMREDAPLTRAMDTRLNGLTLEAGRLAAEVVELLARSAGSSEARPGKRLERYSRDIAMYRTHAAAQYDPWMQGIGATVLGVRASAFDLPNVTV